MSSAVASTSAAQSRLFIFDDESATEVSPHPEPVPNPGAPSLSRRFLLGQGGDSDFRHGLPKGPLPSSDPRLAHITPASRLTIRLAPEMVSSGIAALDILTGGLPRGCITEICGPVSSGRTSVLITALSAATRRGECCALIDASDALDPHSAAAADIHLDRLLWVRCGDISPRRHPSASLRAGSDTEKTKVKSPGCPTLLSRSLRKRVGNDSQSNLNSEKLESRASEHRLEQVLRATDLLLESGGFGLIALDLADVPPDSARRIPLTTWFRFRRAIEHTPTILLVVEPQPIVGSCSSLLLEFSSQLSLLRSQNTLGTDEPPRKPSHTELLTGLAISAELIRSRLSETQFLDSNSLGKTYPSRKPAGSVSIAFHSKTSWG
jgi:recombination protein RecA